MSGILFERAAAGGSGVAAITLNRPEAGNAFNPEMLAEWERALRGCIADDAIRAVVLTGAGRIFCFGGDAKRMARDAAAGQGPWERLARGATVAIRLMKRMVRQGEGSDFRTVPDFAASCTGIAAATEDCREATRAIAEKRKPEFEGR